MFCYVFKSFNVGIAIKVSESQFQATFEERRRKEAKTSQISAKKKIMKKQQQLAAGRGPSLRGPH